MTEYLLVNISICISLCVHVYVYLYMHLCTHTQSSTNKWKYTRFAIIKVNNIDINVIIGVEKLLLLMTFVIAKENYSQNVHGRQLKVQLAKKKKMGTTSDMFQLYLKLLNEMWSIQWLQRSHSNKQKYFCVQKIY